MKLQAVTSDVLKVPLNQLSRHYDKVADVIYSRILSGNWTARNGTKMEGEERPMREEEV
jgi:hypothetical protein